ncbi:major facilitator superfamily domain-containing protein [Elsinoe ampelina]|uniref:Major facilitator superfamily domain-containing protein n=1 Tax=Elsinoe ampelina TaxID=302913 RepID=A0A6A6GS09_9PEZI|nr:major facilitator superfamily domain-containing protein [Elsinoe ampelina]
MGSTTSPSRPNSSQQPSPADSTEAIEQESNVKRWPTDWRAYTTLASGFIFMFNSWGIVNAFGTFLSYYEEILLPDTKVEVFNLIGGTESGIVLAASFIVGRLLDAGYGLYLKITGTILVSLSLFLLSVVNDDGVFGQGSAVNLWAVQGLMAGLGMACFFVTSSQTVAAWFIDYKGFAIGIVACGAAVAGVAYPSMLRYLIDAHGFNVAVRWVSLLCLLTSLLAIFLSKRNPAHQLRPFQKRLSTSTTSLTPSSPHAPSPPLALTTWIDPSALHSRQFLLFTASICFMFFGFYGVFFNLEEWASQTRVAYKGSSPPPCPASQPPETPCPMPGLRTYWLLAIMNGASCIGRLSSSFLCDHFGALRVHSLVTLVAGMLCFTLWTLASTLPAAIAFVVLFGAFSGSVIGLPPASMAAILGNRDAAAQAKLGQWTGMMYTTAAPFALTGPVIEGYLIGRFGFGSGAVQAWSGGCLVVSGGLMWGAHRAGRGKREREGRRWSLASLGSLWEKRGEV